MPPRRRQPAAPKSNGTPTLTPAQARRPAIPIPHIPPQQHPTPLSDSATPQSTVNPSETAARFRTPPMQNPIHPSDFNNPRHPFAAVGPEFRHLDLGAMPTNHGPMVRPGQIEDLPEDWSESADMLNNYLMDYFKKQGFHRTAAIFAQDSGIELESGPPGVDTQTGLLDEVWAVFWPAIVHRHPELAGMPPAQLARLASLSPGESVPSTVLHELETAASGLVGPGGPGGPRMQRSEAASPMPQSGLYR